MLQWFYFWMGLNKEVEASYTCESCQIQYFNGWPVGINFSYLQKIRVTTEFLSTPQIKRKMVRSDTISSTLSSNIPSLN